MSIVNDGRSRSLNVANVGPSQKISGSVGVAAIQGSYLRTQLVQGPNIVAPDVAGTPTVSPTFSVDLTAALALPSQLTLTRTSAASYVNSAGFLATASANVARFEYDYDGASYYSAGPLLEGSRTNDCLQSNTFTNATWGNFGVTIAQNAVGPDGAANTATTLTATGTTAVIWQNIAQAAGTAYSLYIAPGSGNCWLQILSQDTASGNKTSWFNPSTGKWGIENASTGGTPGQTQSTFTAEKVGGFWRIGFVNTGAATGLIQIGLSDTDAITTVTVGKSIIISKCQTELGLSVSSYIGDTTTAAITRSADVLSSTDATLLAADAWVIEVADLVPSTDATILGINTGIALGATSGNALTTADGGSQTTTDTAAWDNINRAGLAWDGGSSRVSICLNSGTVTTAANTGATPTTLYFGNTNNGASGFLNGHLRSLACYTTLSDAQLDTITLVGSPYSLSASGIAATATETIDSFTSAGTATLAIAATSNQTLAAFTSAGAEVLKLAATANETVADFTSSAAAAVKIAATATNTLDAFTSSAAEVVKIAAAANETVANFTSSATATLSLAATASPTLAAFTSSATATLALAETAAQTLAAFTSSGAATVIISASSSTTLAAFTTAAADVVKIATTANETVANFTSSATATLSIAATANPTLAAFTSTSTSVIKILASANNTTDAFTSTAAASFSKTAVANQTLADFSQTAAATVIVSATANQTLAAFTSAGAEAVKIAGVANETVANFTSASTAQIILTANANNTIENFTTVAILGRELTVVANQLLEDFTQTATSTLKLAAQSSIVLEDMFGQSADFGDDFGDDFSGASRRDTVIQKPFMIYPDRRAARPYLVRL